MKRSANVLNLNPTDFSEFALSMLNSGTKLIYLQYLSLLHCIDFDLHCIDFDLELPVNDIQSSCPDILVYELTIQTGTYGNCN